MFRKSWIAGVLPLIDVRVIDCSGAGGSAPRGQSLLRQQVGCALLPAPSPWVRAEPRANSLTLNTSPGRQRVLRANCARKGMSPRKVRPTNRTSGRRVCSRRIGPASGGRGGKERAANLLAEQRLAPGGGAPCPGAVNYTNVNKRQNPCDPALAKHSHAPSWRNL